MYFYKKDLVCCNLSLKYVQFLEKMRFVFDKRELNSVVGWLLQKRRKTAKKIFSGI